MMEKRTVATSRLCPQSTMAMPHVCNKCGSNSCCNLTPIVVANNKQAPEIEKRVINKIVDKLIM